MVLELEKLFSFQLDKFQEDAIAALSDGKSVVVCAPTGSGKTLIAEYAIHRALAKGKRVFYTTPLKALSNQKFRDFQKISNITEQLVGLITGDIIINPNAPIVVMTTEIFRNMLYETPIGQVGTSLEDVETVVLDECHYISDPQRGTVWEESIIYCPSSIQLLALSATIGNPEELTAWINKVHGSGGKQTVCELVNSNYRPVPLKYYFINKKGIFPLLNEDQTKINNRLKLRKEEQKSLKRQDCPSIPLIVHLLRTGDMLPAIYIIFSRKGCDQAVRYLDNITLVTPEEGVAIRNQLLTFLLGDNVFTPSKGLRFYSDPIEGQNHLISFFNEEPELKENLLNYIADNPEGYQQLMEYLAINPHQQVKVLEYMQMHSPLGRAGYLEPLTRGLGTHHAGMLPAWKELVEQLFEMGLVKVVFATSTLAAGINMPARTTVISALSKRTDSGHSMLTPAEFLQMAGRAGRRGMDEVGYVVTLQSPYEGAKDAAYLATAGAEALRSCFAPSYGMVLNLLQKHRIEEVKDLLEKSFAEYLAQKKLQPEEMEIAALTTEVAKLDIELASIPPQNFHSYDKLKQRLKEEQRLLEILQQQAELTIKKQISPKLPEIVPGDILALKGKHLPVASPLMSILVAKIPGSGQAADLLCLGSDNRWYVVTNADVVDINPEPISPYLLEKLPTPTLEGWKLGKSRKGDELTAVVSNQLFNHIVSRNSPPEIIQQLAKIDKVQEELDNHPLQQKGNPANLIKRHRQRLALRDRLHQSQSDYQRHKINSSYYWDEFLNLVEVLREFKALNGYNPTPLGEAAATIRSENELWLGLALTSGEFDNLEPPHLAAAVSALITETPRMDTYSSYMPSEPVLEVLGFLRIESYTDMEGVNLREIRRNLIKSQNRYELAIPVWLERDLLGIVEQWALGIEWDELCKNTSLDEGDLVRMLRRTVDVLWQIPQIPGVSHKLRQNASNAIASIKRFPI